MKKPLFIALGFLTLLLGTLGIFLPLLPTVPFYLLTAYFWINSSPKLYQRLVNHRYYKKYYQDVIINKKVTKKKLFKMIMLLFIVLLIPFILFDSLHVRIILVIIFIAHLIGGYFYFKKSRDNR